MLSNILSEPDQLPLREGRPPRVFPGPPQHQLDQLPTQKEWRETRRLFAEWNNVERHGSRRAVPGTLGLHVPDDEGKAVSDEAFLLGSEFAHHHPETDGGLHLVLPPSWHAAALEKGWAIPHTLAGQPTVSRWTVLVFAPRDAAEREVVRQLVEVSESFARGSPSYQPET